MSQAMNTIANIHILGWQGRGHVIEFDAYVREVDEGIGPYEFWGSHGVHHDYQVETDIDASSARLIHLGKERKINIAELSEEHASMLTLAIKKWERAIANKENVW